MPGAGSGSAVRIPAPRSRSSASPPAARLLGTAYMAFQFGCQCWATSGVEFGILDAYALHSAAAAQNAVLPGDAVGHDMRVDDLIVEKLEAKSGAIRLPEGPGLGVTLVIGALVLWVPYLLLARSPRRCGLYTGALAVPFGANFSGPPQAMSSVIADATRTPTRMVEIHRRIVRSS